MRYHSAEKWFVMGAVIGLLGCRTSLQEAEPTIQFSVLNPVESKSSELSAGDEVAVCARLDGTESYFLEHATFTTGVDGRLTASPAVYYPQVKQAVTFYAYFPYHTGPFSVPSDQSTATALKKADLCWATASSTPVSSLVPLEFEHTMARLLVVTNQTPTKITVPNALVGGSLEVSTGVFTATIRSEVSTTGSELIVPGQIVSRLIVTVDGVEYVFDGSISLPTGKTTTINLTLNPSTKTATLSGSTTTAWTTGTASGLSEFSVSNTLLLDWAPKAHTRSDRVDRVVFSVKDQFGATANYTVTQGIQYSDNRFSVSFASAELTYPYVVQKIDFYQADQLLQSCGNLLATTVYKRGPSTIGIQDVANAIKIRNLWYATGNLVAAGPRGAAGVGGCRIGDPNDGGLYFQFGSLIGWKGGHSDNGGNGVGIPDAKNNAYWGGATAWSWANDSYVWPTTMSGTPTAWPKNLTTNQWYFAQTGMISGERLRVYAGFTAGTMANRGVGDPCRYYLGGSWFLPSADELAVLTSQYTRGEVPWGTPGYTMRYVPAGQTFGGVSGPSAWFGPGLNQTSIPDPTIHLQIRLLLGMRYSSTGYFAGVGSVQALLNTDQVFDDTQRYFFLCYSSAINTYNNSDRTYAFPVRCVRPI